MAEAFAAIIAFTRFSFISSTTAAKAAAVILDTATSFIAAAPKIHGPHSTANRSIGAAATAT